MSQDQLKSQVEMYEKYKTVFNTLPGQEVLNDLAKESGFFASSVDLDNPDPCVTAYHDGARTFFIRILEILGKDTVALMKMYDDITEQPQGEE